MAQIYGGRWEIKSSLGEGGQGRAFLVTDTQELGQLYVLKQLKNLDRIQRFRDEIEAARSLSHENILRLVDFELEGDKPYLVTEYCSGGSLAKVKPYWKDSPAQAIGLFEQICQGVDFAHRHTPPIVHRDLKPDNIFLRGERGPAVVGDFGICYIDDNGTRVTLTEEAVGPRLYMAPELEDGRVDQISTKSDVYSLGKLLYWLFSGKVFSREKHRDPQWDLKGRSRWSGRGPTEAFWDNVYMEHLNRLLDHMVVDDPDKRWGVDAVLAALPEVKRLIEDEFNPIGTGLQQRCLYCGLGHYVLRADTAEKARNLGFEGPGSPHWRILICDTCGHVQIFRIEQAEGKDWWLSEA